MSIVSMGPGWWQASDGNWYAPELHPANATRATPALSASAVPELDSAWAFKSLRYGGACLACGIQIPKNTMGWHSPTIKKVRCPCCPPVASSPGPAVPAVDPVARNPVGGSSALRVAQQRKDRRWRKGAAGEYIVDQVLHEELRSGEVILSDRKVPGSSANIDFVVVASSGIWVIDAKKWRGKLEYKAANRLGTKMVLLVDGVDRTSTFDEIYNLVIPIRQCIPDWSVPIEPALTFVQAEWTGRAAVKLFTTKPHKNGLVWFSAPRIIAAKIREPGPLSAEAVAHIAQILDEQLPPR